MNVFSIKKIQKLYHKHTENIHSFDFRRMPPETRKSIPENDLKTIVELPLLRLEDQRSLLVNEGCEGWEDMLKLLIALDTLPDAVLRDMYAYYSKRLKGVSINSIKTFNDDETARRITFFLAPEIMWCNGNDTVKSRIFE